MLNSLKKLFKSSPAVNYNELMKQGAIILDVRTSSEFSTGHVKGSINIPVQNLSSQLNKLNQQKAVITCCASGMRSASAKSILKNNGFTAYNGGSWLSLQQKLNAGH